MQVCSRDPKSLHPLTEGRKQDPSHPKAELDVDFYRYLPIDYHFCYNKDVLLSRFCWEESKKRPVSSKSKKKTVMSRFDSQRSIKPPGLLPAAQIPDKPPSDSTNTPSETPTVPKPDVAPSRPKSSASSFRPVLSRQPLRFKENGSLFTFKGPRPLLAGLRKQPPTLRESTTRPCLGRPPVPSARPDVHQPKTTPADPYLARRQQLVNRIKFLSNRNIAVNPSGVPPKLQASYDD